MPARHRDSMAAPVWHAARYCPLIVAFLEERTRLNGADWLSYWAVAKAARARVIAGRASFIFVLYRVCVVATDNYGCVDLE